jgi:hypothetical protein
MNQKQMIAYFDRMVHATKLGFFKTNPNWDGPSISYFLFCPDEQLELAFQLPYGSNDLYEFGMKLTSSHSSPYEKIVKDKILLDLRVNLEAFYIEFVQVDDYSRTNLYLSNLLKQVIPLMFFGKSTGYIHDTESELYKAAKEDLDRDGFVSAETLRHYKEEGFPIPSEFAAYTQQPSSN